MFRRMLPCSAILLLSLTSAVACGSRSEMPSFVVVAYNVENLFDIDGESVFSDYSADAYTPAHLLTKLTNITRTLATFQEGRGPEVILFQELEMDQTPGEEPFEHARFLRRYAGTTVAAMLAEPVSREVRDLPATSLLLKSLHDAGLGPYQVAVAESRPNPSDRQIAHVNATFSRFPIAETKSHHTLGARTILEAVLDVQGHRLYTFNNHWKSGASDPGTEPTRVGNARVLRDRIDQILASDPQADIVLGGDFNSQYNQSLRYPQMNTTGVCDILGSQGDELALRQNGGPDLYNLWFELPPDQRGSDVYRGQWGTLMQMLITPGLYDYRGVQYVDNSFEVAILENVNAQAGSRVPLAWNFEGDVGGGFSDHFPVYAHFRVVDDGDPTRYLRLQIPGQAEQGADAPRSVDYAAVHRSTMPVAQRLGSDAALRQGDHVGQVYLVEARVSGERPFRVRLFEQEYTVWAHDLELRREIYRRYPVEAGMVFYGELGLHRGQWQFLVRARSWLDPSPGQSPAAGR